MGRTVDEIFDALPKARRARVLARYRSLKSEVENLRKKSVKQKKTAAGSSNVNDIIRKLGPVQRRRVEARAAELIAEEMTLRELRRARKLTQVKLRRSKARRKKHR